VDTTGEPGYPVLSMVADFNSSANPTHMLSTDAGRLAMSDDRATNPQVRPLSPRREKERREEWIDLVDDIMRKMKIPRMVLRGPPAAQEILKRQPTLAAEDVQKELTAAMLEYQTMNSAFWDAIRDTVTIAGPYESIDRAALKENFTNGDLRDGYGFYSWVLQFSDATTLSAQLELQKKLEQFPGLNLQGTVTVQRIEMFATQLLSAWTAVATNDIDKPASYILRLLHLSGTSHNAAAI
jgi:hypothetical protein